MKKSAFAAWFLALAFSTLSAKPALAAAGPYDVGILRGSNGCPVGSASVWIMIDNEDRRNANNRGGWQGASVSTGNTQFEFCVVNGGFFSNLDQPYMVLSFNRSTCPPGAQRIMRHFDSENNRPITNTNFSDPFMLIPDPISRDIDLYFCVFPGGGFSGSFPNFGVQYGVFAPANFRYAIQAGFFYLDDEDSGNTNHWIDQFNQQSGTGADRNFWDILNGGVNTGMDVARVR
jgi:hypothetical protein